MRRNRIIWWCTFLLALVGISFFGGPVSYGFLTMVIMIPLISIVYLVCVNFCFRIYQKMDSNRLYAGQMIPFYFKLNNEFFFAFSGIRVRFFTSFSTISGLDDETEYELHPGTGIEKETGLVCKYRGEYEVGIKTVEIQDFLRLFRYAYRNPETLRVVVKPRLVYLQEMKHVDVSGVMARDTSYQEEFPDVTVREYAVGDDPRLMHWSSSARSGKLMVRKQIGEEKQGIGIVLETMRYEKEMAKYLPAENKMLESLLALALYFTGKNIPVQTWFGAEHFQVRHVGNLGQFHEFYDAVSEIAFEETEKTQILAEQLMKSAELFRCKMVFLVLHRWTEEMQIVVDSLGKNQVHTVVLMIREPGAESLGDVKVPYVDFLEIDPEADISEVM